MKLSERLRCGFYEAAPRETAQADFRIALEDAREQAKRAAVNIEFLNTVDGEVPEENYLRQKTALGALARLERFQSKGQVPVEIDAVIFGRSRFSFEVGRKTV